MTTSGTRHLAWALPVVVAGIVLLIGGGQVAQIVGAVLLLAVVALVVVWVRSRYDDPAVERQWAWELLLLPLVLSLGNAGAPRVLTLSALAALALVATLRRPLTRIRHAAPALLLLAALLWVVVRASTPVPFIVAIGAFWVIWFSARAVGRDRALASIIDGVGLYLIANVVGYFGLGLRSVAADLRIGSLDSTFGSFERVIFPFVTNLNLAPVMGALFLASVPLLFQRAGALRLIFRLSALVCAVVVIVAANGRAALTVGVLVAVLVLLVPALLQRAAPVVSVLSLGFVALYPFLVGAITSAFLTVTTLIPSLTRDDGAEDPASLANRDIIWERSTSFWVNDVPSLSKLLGYGIRGQFSSGASGTYGYLLSGTTLEPQLASVHNSSLQQLYDGGLVGVLLMGAGIVLALWRISRVPSKSPVVLAALGALVVLVVTSTTEISLAPGYEEESYFVLLALCLALSTPELPRHREGLLAPEALASRPAMA